MNHGTVAGSVLPEYGNKVWLALGSLGSMGCLASLLQGPRSDRARPAKSHGRFWQSRFPRDMERNVGWGAASIHCTSDAVVKIVEDSEIPSNAHWTFSTA